MAKVTFGRALNDVARAAIATPTPPLSSQLYAMMGFIPGFRALGPLSKVLVLAAMFTGAWLATIGASTTGDATSLDMVPGPIIMAEGPLQVRTVDPLDRMGPAPSGPDTAAMTLPERAEPAPDAPAGPAKAESLPDATSTLSKTAVEASAPGKPSDGAADTVAAWGAAWSFPPALPSATGGGAPASDPAPIVGAGLASAQFAVPGLASTPSRTTAAPASAGISVAVASVAQVSEALSGAASAGTTAALISTDPVATPVIASSAQPGTPSSAVPTDPSANDPASSAPSLASSSPASPPTPAPAQVDPFQIGPFQIGPTQIGPAQIGPADAGPALADLPSTAPVPVASAPPSVLPDTMPPAAGPPGPAGTPLSPNAPGGPGAQVLLPPPVIPADAPISTAVSVPAPAGLLCLLVAGGLTVLTRRRGH